MKRQGIAKRISIYVLVISIAISLVHGIVELFLAHQTQKNRVDRVFSHIRLVPAYGIASAISHGDRKKARELLADIVKGERLLQARLALTDGTVITVGNEPVAGSPSLTVPLPSFHSDVRPVVNESEPSVGTLTVYSENVNAVDLLIRNTSEFLISDVAASLALCIAFYFVFQLVLGRRLSAIARSLEHVDANNVTSGLPLTGLKSKCGHDELCDIIDALNGMWGRIARSVAETRAGEEKFRLLTENARDMIFRYRHRPTPQFEYVSPSSTAITGYSPEEHYADPALPSKTVHPDDRAKLLEAVQNPGDAPVVIRLIRPDGTIRWIEERCSIIRDDEGRYVGIDGIIRDITEQKRAEEQRALYERQMVHAEKLASIGTLAAGVAHEINNPLTIIRGNITLLEEDLEEAKVGKVGQDQIPKIKEAVSRIVAIVNGLRTYARKDSDRLEKISVECAVKDSIVLAEGMLRSAEVKTETSITPGPNGLLIMGNVGKLQQVLINLLANAKDATEGLAEKRIKISAFSEAGSVKIVVKDNGSGISDDDLRRIFDPFFTTKPEGKGTGLGLSISQSLVQGMGGTIEVKGNPGAGAEFTVKFPMAAVEPSA